MSETKQCFRFLPNLDPAVTLDAYYLAIDANPAPACIVFEIAKGDAHAEIPSISAELLLIWLALHCYRKSAT